LNTARANYALDRSVGLQRLRREKLDAVALLVKVE
jgi:hypothetical protein